MQILIFEGIATSGKSTVIRGLAEILQPKGLRIIVADEEITHDPIMNQRDALHIDFFKELIEKFIADKPDLILIDRLYMTQALRAKSDLSSYRELENILLPYNPTTIFLSVDEAAIAERIRKATEHRNPEWGEYVKSKGAEGAYADYCIEQQRSQQELLGQSLIPFRIFDTTNHEYATIVDCLVDLIQG